MRSGGESAKSARPLADATRRLTRRLLDRQAPGSPLVDDDRSSAPQAPGSPRALAVAGRRPAVRGTSSLAACGSLRSSRPSVAAVLTSPRLTSARPLPTSHPEAWSVVERGLTALVLGRSQSSRLRSTPGVVGGWWAGPGVRHGRPTNGVAVGSRRGRPDPESRVRRRPGGDVRPGTRQSGGTRNGATRSANLDDVSTAGRSEGGRGAQRVPGAARDLRSRWPPGGSRAARQRSAWGRSSPSRFRRNTSQTALNGPRPPKHHPSPSLDVG
jgi:hypothetical protein